MLTLESWFKVGLPALPAVFTLLGVGGYWGENPLPILAPSLAFWGVVVVYYLFGRIYAPKTFAPFWLAVSTAILWLLSAITSHNLAKFIASNKYGGIGSVLANKDFLWAYGFAMASVAIGLWQFLVHEPKILEHDRQMRGLLLPEKEE